MGVIQDFEFEVIHNQINLIDKQIKILQESKPKIFKAFNTTHQTYYTHLRKYNNRKGLEE